MNQTKVCRVNRRPQQDSAAAAAAAAAKAGCRLVTAQLQWTMPGTALCHMRVCGQTGQSLSASAYASLQASIGRQPLPGPPSYAQPPLPPQTSLPPPTHPPNPRTHHQTIPHTLFATSWAQPAHGSTHTHVSLAVCTSVLQYLLQLHLGPSPPLTQPTPRFLRPFAPQCSSARCSLRIICMRLCIKWHVLHWDWTNVPLRLGLE